MVRLVGMEKDIKVCYKSASEFWDNDEFFIFTDEREESYVIPTGADGADKLWSEIITRGLFPAELSIKISMNSGTMGCWPPENEK